MPPVVPSEAPTRVGLLCRALRTLGGSATPEQIRTAARGMHPPDGAWLDTRGPDLSLILAQRQGDLWIRAPDGTYALTARGLQFAGG